MALAASASHGLSTIRHDDDATVSTRVMAILQAFPTHKEQLRRFLSDFSRPDIPDGGLHGRKPYMHQLQRVADRKSTVVKVRVDDVAMYADSVLDERSGYDKMDPALPSLLISNSPRYTKVLYEAVEDLMKTLTPHIEEEDDASFEVSQYERGFGRLDAMEASHVPTDLRAPYEVRIVPPASMKSLTVREVRAEHIGMLVKMDCVVTKISSIRPRLQVAYYKCFDCGSDVHQHVEGLTFLPLTFCSSPICLGQRKKGELRLLLPESKFVTYQEVKVQEPIDRVPTGAIPRTQKIVVEGSLTRQLLPGMAATLSGVLMPVPKAGYQALRAGLLTETTFHVCDLEIQKKGYDLDLGHGADQENRSKYGVSKSGGLNSSVEDDCEAAEARRVLLKYQSDPHLYERMAKSIAPAIHGLEDVKKALLLQLVGGVTERFSDGMQLRGDLHILLMGDPGVAKSQLLGQICRIAPRAHYTTGKGASGVGLTASVVRDPMTGDFTLEGGAIVLSDRGICCIDEFDKMDEYDRTAIHEVMEQQTVSISKAGLTTTLNARTSILAAANPQYGRYNPTKSPSQNINLPAALLSRFDVLFLLLDRADQEADHQLAKHVLKVHQAGGSGVGTGETGTEFLDAKTMRILIAKARSYNPLVPEGLIDEIVDYYIEMRQREREDRSVSGSHTYTTPRTLLGILRLSQAIARLRFSSVIDRGDFEEAVRLMIEAKRSLVEEEENSRHRKKRADYQSDLLEILKELDNKLAKQHLGHVGQENRPPWNGWILLRDVEDRISRLGYTKDQLIETINCYIELNVLKWKDHLENEIGFVDRLADFE